MKQWLSMLLAGMMGGLLVLTVLEGREWLAPSAITTSDLPVRQVNFAPRAALAMAPLDFKAAAKTATPAVVHISANSGASTTATNPLQFFFDGESPYANPGRSTGSGVIYTSDGYIITNNHVVDGAESLLVTLSDNRKFDARVIGRDDKTDLAVIKIEASSLPTLELANSDVAEIGEWVLAVGNPLDLSSTVTAGIISAKGRSLELLPGRDAIEAFLQTDAAVNPGNSGGALVDTEGRLLGINTAIATRTGMFQGYSFAIPVNLAVRIVDDIIEYGSFQRAFLGVTIYPLEPAVAAELATDRSQGVVIDELVDGGSAQYAGLLPRDIIIQVNEREIKDVPELTEIVGRSKVGDLLQVTVIRKGEVMKVPVRMRADEG